jgi:hypothetical protein
MHRQVNALVSAGGSPGKLAVFGRALGDAGLDIETIGGAEWKHDGPLSLVLRQDGHEAMERFAMVCSEHHVPWLSFINVEVELDDQAGSLGNAAEALDNINIYSLLVRKPHGNRAVVDMGFRPNEADEAVTRLNTAQGVRANRKENPDEPDAMIQWDERTENLLPLWDDPDVAKDDQRFWETPPTD